MSPAETKKAARHTIAFNYNASSVDAPFFRADREYKVVGIVARPRVVGSDGGAVTAAVKKAPSGTAPASGTAVHSGTIDLKGTADTDQTLTLSTTGSDTDLAPGDCLTIDFTGTMTAAVGAVFVTIEPK